MLGPRRRGRGRSPLGITAKSEFSDARLSNRICRFAAIPAADGQSDSSEIVVSRFECGRAACGSLIASGSDLRWPRPLVVVSYAPGSAREAKLVTRAVRSTVRSIAGFPPRPGPSDTSEDPDGYGIYGTMGHCAPAGHQVEGLVRGFPGGGSSPLRRMKRKPRKCGAFALPARARSVGCAIDAETSMAFAPRGLDL
jgi:hypothetical protein